MSQMLRAAGQPDAKAQITAACTNSSGDRIMEDAATCTTTSKKASNFQAVTQKTSVSYIPASHGALLSDTHAAAAAAAGTTVVRQSAVPQQQASTSTSDQLYRIEDFTFGRVVGAGSFGRVYIGKHHPSGQTLAIKCMSKSACIQGGQVKHLLDERKLLVQMQHPFLVRLKGTFQSQEAVFLAMEFVAGGEFFTLLRDKGRLREEHARFYAAQIVLALDYMHSKHILYRDLKPENVLVAADGYIRLTDMGFAKVVPVKTYTMCGTPDYMAPEVVLNRGHNRAVDWWSLGCLIYEMMFGYPPFFTGKANETYRKIIDPASLAFPENFSSLARDLLRGLLQHDPSLRLGIKGKGVAEIKEHPWFGGLDWSYVLSKMYKPPHLPAPKGGDETSNFDDFSTLAPLRHPFVLTSEQQSQFIGF